MTDQPTTTRPATGAPEVVEVAWDDPRAVALRGAMDQEMGRLYGDAPSPEVRRALAVDPADVLVTVIAVDAGEGVGHAALRRLGDGYEVKKVVVSETHRRRGISRALLAAVEDAARARGATRAVLQTGDRQPEAMALYEATGWRRIPVYPPYDVLANSRCYAKDLTA